MKSGETTYIAYGENKERMDIYEVLFDGKVHQMTRMKWPNIFRFRPETYWDLVTLPKKITMKEIQKEYGQPLLYGETVDLLELEAS